MVRGTSGSGLTLSHFVPSLIHRKTLRVFHACVHEDLAQCCRPLSLSFGRPAHGSLRSPFASEALSGRASRTARTTAYRLHNPK